MFNENYISCIYPLVPVEVTLYDYLFYLPIVYTPFTFPINNIPTVIQLILLSKHMHHISYHKTMSLIIEFDE